MQGFIEYIRQSTELIIALGAFIVAAIAVYRQVKAALQEKARVKLAGEAIAAIAKVERNPMAYNHTLVNQIENTHAELQSIDGKTLLVVNGLKERSPETVRAAGLETPGKLLAFVEQVYEQSGPLISGQR